ncbi:MAG TPA: NAD(P)H-hydrate dehydratase [Clostridia bacterium]
MKLVTPKQMNEIDSNSINKLGIPGIVLMERAALGVCDVVLRTLSDMKGKRVAIFAGKGNNGGDGFALARQLYTKGVFVKVCLLSFRDMIKGDARINLNILKSLGIDIQEFTEKDALPKAKEVIEVSDVVVDAIFGTGMKGEITGFIRDIVEMINLSGKKVISVDIPSGVDASTGRVSGTSISASKTVTFAYPKTGQVIHPGCEYTGELVISDIGIPDEALEGVNIDSHLIDDQMVHDIIPKRHDNTNKGDYGRILVVTGSTGMTGAGCLTAMSALRSGAGLLYIAAPKTLCSIYDCNVLEPVTIPLEDKGEGVLVRESVPDILKMLEKADAAVVGPGLSTGGDVREVVEAIVENSNVPLVLDADALNVLSLDISILKRLKVPAVLTPHPGEMARLTGISVGEIQDRRLDIAMDFAAKWGVTVVLKGSRTVVASHSGKIYINPSGNSGMATAGAGDVLSGIISGLAGQGINLLDAAVAGVYIHGCAGDEAQKINGTYGLVAGDIVDKIPYVINRLQNI